MNQYYGTALTTLLKRTSVFIS